MATKSQFGSLPLSQAQKNLARIATISIVATVCASLAACSAAGPATQANRGGCIKCVGYNWPSPPPATQSQATLSAADQSTSARP